jgi:arsenite methyltransferase
MTAAIGGVCPRGGREFLEEACEGVMRPGGLTLTARALGRCALGAGARVLDLGCGAGVSVGYLRDALGLRATGLDTSRTALEQGLRRDAGLVLVQSSASALPFASGSLAAILAECSLSLVPERASVLSECRRVLAPGGKLVVTDLYARDPGAVAPLRALPVACGAEMTTQEGLTREIEAQGFRVEVWEDHSPRLAELACRLVMAGGSARDVWLRPGASEDEGRRVVEAVRRARPGYFLLVATSRGEVPSTRREGR